MPQLLFNGRFDDKSMPLTAESMINYFIEQDMPKSMLLIVPTGRIVNYTKFRFIEEYFKRYKKPCSLPNIFTLQKFAEHCYFNLFKDKPGRLISEPYYLTLIEEAVNNSELEFFRNEKNKTVSIALINKIASVIYGIKEDGITPEILQKDLENYQPGTKINRIIGGVKEPKRLKDISIIYSKYQQLLGDSLLDKIEVLHHLNRKLSIGESENKLPLELFSPESFITSPADESFPIDYLFSEESIMLFYGFSEFKLPEIEFISHFSASKLPVAINLDYTEFNGPLFGNLKDTAMKLTSAKFNNKTILDDELINLPNPDDDIHLAPSKYLRRWLFNTDMEIRNPHLAKSIKVLSADNAIDEVRSIAKLVHHLVKVDNISTSDICICMRNTEAYSPLFREIFALNNIPAFITDRFHLSNSQLVTTIVGVMELVVGSFRRVDLIKLLQSSFLKIKNNDGEEIDRINLISVAIKLRIIAGFDRGGKKAWQDALKKKIDYFKARKDEIASISSDDNDIRRIEQELISLEKALKDFETISGFIDFENISFTPKQINSLINTKIIKGLGIENSIIEFFKDVHNKKNELEDIEYLRLLEEVEKDAAALSKFSDLVNELTCVADELYKDKLIKLEDFLYKLKVAVSSEKYQVKEKSGWGVKITAVEQTRGIPYKAIILCGCIDGQFPLSYRTETMLGKILPNSEIRHAEAEKVLFYQVLTNNPALLDSGEQKIFLTYPRFRENEELVPSTFISALYKVSTIKVNDSNQTDYVPKYYDMKKLRAISKLDDCEIERLQISDIPWISYITEKSEVLKLYAANEISTLPDSNISDDDLIYIENIDKCIDNIKMPENLKNDVLSELANKTLDNYLSKSYSISEFEEYALCPQKYFISRVLRINEKIKDSVELTPLEKGEVLHNILFLFYSKLQKEIPDSQVSNSFGIKTVKLEEKQRDYYLHLLMEIAEKEIESLNYAHVFFEMEKAAILGINGRKGIIEMWLDAEIERHKDPNNEFFPALFEHSFGMGKSKSTSKYNEPVEFENGIKVKGKLDRLEFDERINKYLVADYKTKISNLPKLKDIEEGRKFQIPIYIAAAKHFLHEQFNISDIVGSGAVYYGFNKYIKGNDKETNEVVYYEHKDFLRVKEDFSSKELEAFLQGKAIHNFHVYVPDYDELERLINQSLDYNENIAKNISNGIFAKNIDSESCKYCSYSAICRRTDTKTMMAWQEKEEQSGEEN